MTHEVSKSNMSLESDSFVGVTKNVGGSDSKGQGNSKFQQNLERAEKNQEKVNESFGKPYESIEQNSSTLNPRETPKLP